MPGPFDWLTNSSLFRGIGSTYDAARAHVAQTAGREVSPRERYAIQRAYYANNRLYDDLARWFYDAGIARRSVRGLRNPAFRIVEFYPSLLWPGDLPKALPLKADNQRIVPAIQQVWKWSNWARKKQLYARWLPMLGDCFIKVVKPDNAKRVYFELIDPVHVSSFETDERDNVVELRIDIPKSREESGQVRNYTQTEVWSKANQTYRRWEHPHGLDAELSRLGNPTDTRTFESMGIDFVPIVHVPFRDIGDLRGAGAFWFQIDKIDQLNAEATRLSQIIFRHNKQTLAFIGGKDAGNRPMPPPQVGDGAGGVAQRVEMRDETVISLPGDARVESLVPNLNYEAHLKLIESGVEDLSRDCVEMLYWQMVDFDTANISGRALNYILGPAVHRAIEVRGSGEDGMVKAAEMALTLGKNDGLAGFVEIGDYRAGDFEHAFETRPVIEENQYEQAQTQQVTGSAVAAWTQAGVSLESALRLVLEELTDEQIARIVSLAEAERKKHVEEQRENFGGNPSEGETAAGRNGRNGER